MSQQVGDCFEEVFVVHISLAELLESPSLLYLLESAHLLFVYLCGQSNVRLHLDLWIDNRKISEEGLVRRGLIKEELLQSADDQGLAHKLSNLRA